MRRFETFIKISLFLLYTLLAIPVVVIIGGALGIVKFLRGKQ